MLADPWQFGLVAVLFATSVAVSYWLYRRLQDPGGRSPLGLDRETADSWSSLADPSGDQTEPTSTDPTASTERETVTCPACGTPNDPRYRFCRACVAELSASGVVGDGAGDRPGDLPR